MFQNFFPLDGVVDWIPVLVMSFLISPPILVAVCFYAVCPAVLGTCTLLCQCDDTSLYLLCKVSDLFCSYMHGFDCVHCQMN